MNPYQVSSQRRLKAIAEKIAQKQRVFVGLPVNSVDKLLDQLCEGMHGVLEKSLQAAYPQHTYLAEEKALGDIRKNYWRCIFLPERDIYIRNGTSYSIALNCYADGMLEHCTINFPHSKRYLHATAGYGVFSEGAISEQQRLRAKQRFAVDESVIASNYQTTTSDSKAGEIISAARKIVHSGSYFCDLLLYLEGQADLLLIQNPSLITVEILNLFSNESASLIKQWQEGDDNYVLLAAASIKEEQIKNL